jgi:hypothetical protein
VFEVAGKNPDEAGLNVALRVEMPLFVGIQLHVATKLMD